MKNTRKSTISGLICEFNPLHMGHKAILQQMAAEGPVVCVMSGNFVQRGEAAALDKWTRTRMALSCGADLVIELPLPFATAGAESFALGGVGILNALGCVDKLWFGSESGDILALTAIAVLLDSPALTPLLKAQCTKGLSFASAREAAVKELLGSAKELKGPNNNLAIEYIRAINRLGSSIAPHTIKRMGTGHDQGPSGGFCSAMHIRGLMSRGEDALQLLPPEIAPMLEEKLKDGSAPVSLMNAELAVLAKLRCMSPARLALLPDLSEGIENKLYKAIRSACSLEELYFTVKSKRYSLARIRRLVLNAYLGITADMRELHYIRILGMTEEGGRIIKKKTGNLPIVGKAADIKKLSPKAAQAFELEARAGDLYALCSPKIQPCGGDYTSKLIRI